MLADGEGVPDQGANGTSFAAPQVAATVANVQAIVWGLAGHALGLGAMVDVLQQGGNGPRSRVDPADGSTVMTSGMNVSTYGSDMTGWALYNAVCSG